MALRAASVPAAVRVKVGEHDPALAPARGDHRAENERPRPAADAAAGWNYGDFAEARNVDKGGIRVTPGLSIGEPLRRAPRRDHAVRPCSLEGAFLGEMDGHRPGQNERAATVFAALTSQYFGVEGLMQDERAGAEEPRNQRHADAGKRGRQDRRQDICTLGQMALKQHAKAAGEQFCVVASDRDYSVSSDIEGDGGDVQGGIARSLAVKRFRVELPRIKQIIERHHAVGQAFAKAAYVTDGKYFGGDFSSEPAMIEGADACASDQRLGADAGERRGCVGAAPQKRQRCSDHSRAQHAEHGQNIFDDIRKLDRDNAIGRQRHAVQLRGDRRDDAVGLRVGQASRRGVGERLAVRRIGERQRLRPLLGDVAKHFVDGKAARYRRRRRACAIAEDHCSVRCG